MQKQDFKTLAGLLVIIVCSVDDGIPKDSANCFLFNIVFSSYFRIISSFSDIEITFFFKSILYNTMLTPHKDKLNTRTLKF